MGKNSRRTIQPEEQEVLDGLELELLSLKEDIAKSDELIVKHHYLHNASLVGEHLRYVATYKGQWLAIATWSAAALHIKARDRFINWSHEQCRRRRALLANNSRLLVLPKCHYPNLISKMMKMMLGRLSKDWQERWGHPVVLAESFVDGNLYQGTAYKVSGWSMLGGTVGWKRDAGDFYLKHGSPKQIWIRELEHKACEKLRAAELPEEWRGVEQRAGLRCTTRAVEIRSLMARLDELKEFRRGQSLAYPVAGMVALTVIAMATGVNKGREDLETFAATLSQGQLRALKFRCFPGTRKLRAPGRTTFGRVLEAVDAEVLEKILLEWQEQLLGPGRDRMVIVDGKKMRHGKGEIVNAVDAQGRFLGSVITRDKSNEIPAARELLKKCDLTGKLVVTDALHTQVETAQQILFEQGGDYLMTVKDNQKTLHRNLKHLFEKQDCSPSAAGGDTGVEAGAKLRAPGNPAAGGCGSQAQAGEFPWSPGGLQTGDTRQAQGAVDAGNRLPDQQPAIVGDAGQGISAV